MAGVQSMDFFYTRSFTTRTNLALYSYGMVLGIIELQVTFNGSRVSLTKICQMSLDDKITATVREGGYFSYHHDVYHRFGTFLDVLLYNFSL